MVGDGPERNKIERLCRAKLDNSAYTFLGNLKSTIEVLNISDVFILPSEKESFGLAALEAMASSVPVISTCSGGIPEVIEDGKSGYLSKINDLTKAKIKTMTDFPPEVNVSDFVDHIDYLVEKMGLDHVGISSDFDGGGGIEGWNDASETFNVTLELVRRGYSEDQIEQLWSGNLLRVLDECQAVAEGLK